MPYGHSIPIFFFNDPATTEIYTLSLHDALPICRRHAHVPAAGRRRRVLPRAARRGPERRAERERTDRKSTRLNSSHTVISYAVFCLKKKQAKERATDIAAELRRDENSSFFATIA